MGRRVCSRLGDAVLLAFLPDLYCLFLIYCWLWGLVSVGSVVLGRTGGPKGPLSVCRAKPENRGRGLCQYFEHVTVPAGEAKRIMEADNAANVSGFSRARAMRVTPGSVLTALNPESLGITDMSVYGKSGKPLAPVVAGTRFDATASAEKAASKYGVTVDGAIQDSKTRNRIMREVLKNAVAEKFLPRKVKYKVSGTKYGQMKIAISVPGDYDNPQFNTWSVSCSGIAGKDGLHDPGYVSVDRVPSATGLELRERVRDVALSVFGSYEAGEGDGQWHPYCDVDVEIVGADAKDDPSAYYEYQRFTDDERMELSRIWETVEPEPVRGVIAHCETAHPGKRRKRPYNRYIRGRVVEREPFTWFEN